MKQIGRLLKEHDFRTVYESLNEINYNYTIENFERDFKKNDSADKFCYLVYLISKEKIPANVLLLCDFLMYTDTFFYDVHAVIYDYLCQIMRLFPDDKKVLEWVVATYDSHPDSPFHVDEIEEFKIKLQCQAVLGFEN